VFGGIAGASMARWVRGAGPPRAPDMAAVKAAVEATTAPLRLPPGDVEPVREQLYDAMWKDAGIIRNAGGLARAAATLDELDARLDRTGVPADQLAYGMAWQDWLNLKSLVLVSRAIVAAAQARTDSCGAHYREDFPREPDPARASFTEARLDGAAIRISRHPVAFIRVKPGESLLRGAA
jgi:fumarate reductase flavoprotein subunit